MRKLNHRNFIGLGGEPMLLCIVSNPHRLLLPMKNLFQIILLLSIGFSCSLDPCECGQKAANTYYSERLKSDCTAEAYKNNPDWVDSSTKFKIAAIDDCAILEYK